jgi:hypothetical protein
MKISTNKLYEKTRIKDNFPYIGPSNSIIEYFDDALDNLMALHICLDDYTNTKSAKAEIKKCMENLSKIKDAVNSIDYEENMEDYEIR